MKRARAWRRYKDYTKAKRKRHIDYLIYGAHSYWYPWYHNLHQYSKNKIHCSCSMCRRKTRNNGAAALYSGSYNPTRMDRRRSDSMAADLKTIGELTKEMKYVKFYLDNGYGGTQIDYASFENEVSEDEIDEMLTELAEDNAEAFEYLAMDGGEWASDEEQEEYYENASTYCTWAYVTEEEYYDEI